MITPDGLAAPDPLTDPLTDCLISDWLSDVGDVADQPPIALTHTCLEDSFMRNRARAAVVAVTTTGLIAGVPAVAALAKTEYPSGGVWTYGANAWVNYSHYDHPTKSHRSSVKNCHGLLRSKIMPAGKTAYIAEPVCISGNQAFYNVF